MITIHFSKNVHMCNYSKLVKYPLFLKMIRCPTFQNWSTKNFPKNSFLPKLSENCQLFSNMVKIIRPNRINLPWTRSQWQKNEWEKGRISATWGAVRADLFYGDSLSTFPKMVYIRFFPNWSEFLKIQKYGSMDQINYVAWSPSTYRLIKCWFLSTWNKKFIKMKEKNYKFFNNWFKLS